MKPGYVSYPVQDDFRGLLKGWHMKGIQKDGVNRIGQWKGTNLKVLVLFD